MTLLAQFYCAPFKMMPHVMNRLSFRILWVHLILLVLSQLYLIGPTMGPFILFFLVIGFVLFFQTLIVDFFAHLFYGTTHSLRCFVMLSLAWCPVLLDHVVYRISQIPGASTSIFELWSGIATLFIIVLQIYGIRCLYGLQTRHALVLFLSPILLTALIAILVVIGSALV